MDTTPSGFDFARRLRRHEITYRTANRWAPFVALLTVALISWTGITTAQESDLETSVMAPLAPKSLMLDAVRVGDRLVVVGERGHLLVSDDGGADWRQIEVPTRVMLTAVTFVNDEVGLAVGHDSVILRTTDGGDTWDQVYRAPEDEAPFFDVWFSDEANGVAIGAYGSHFRTTDGGVTWNFEPLGETDWHLHQIARSDDGRLFVAAEAGFIYRSDDGGATWIELISPYEGSYFGVLPLGGDALLIYGLRGHLFRSEDAGETWAEIPTDTVALLDAGTKLDDGTVLVAGLGGTVLISNDDGRTFSKHQQPGRRGITAVVQGADGSLLMTGEFGLRMTTMAELTAAAE